MQVGLSITTDITKAKTSALTTTSAYVLSNYTLRQAQDTAFTGQYSYMDDLSTPATEGFGLMFYNARFYDPYLNHFTQPDTIVPDPSNSQDWDRYSYVRNNPLRYTDPSGHSVDCGLGDPYCASGTYTPNGLINLYRNINGKDNLKAPYNSPNIVREKLSKEIEDYLISHPNYKIKNDLRSSTNYGLFDDIRHEYWRNRCSTSGGCDLLADPDNLYRYYDLHKDIQFMKFDPSKVDWGSTSFDVGSLGLSVIGLQAVTKGAKWLANSASVVLGGGSAAYSFGNSDSTGGWLSVAGFLPPPFGTAASGSSVIRDVAAGVYYEPYIPSLPR